MADRLDVYEDSAGEWRWRVVAGNGRVIAASGESFASAWNAKRAGIGANPTVDFGTPYVPPAEPEPSSDE